MASIKQNVLMCCHSKRFLFAEQHTCPHNDSQSAELSGLRAGLKMGDDALAANGKIDQLKKRQM
jgi:hypothetical protein